MKKIFTTVFALSLAGIGFSQSLHILQDGNDITNSSITVNIDPSTPYVNELELLNSSSGTISYQVNRTVMSGPLDTDAMLYFCTGTQCYSPQSATTWTPSTAPASLGPGASLPSGSGTYGISAHYDVGETASSMTVKYRVYNTDSGTNDTAYVTINYVSATAGVQENAASGNVYNAYPNPASTIASIKYDMNEFSQSGKIVIYDMLGKKMKEIVLADKQGIVKIDVSGLTPGIYFYAFAVNDKVLATKKLIVSGK